PILIVLAIALAGLTGYWQWQRIRQQLPVQVLDYRIAKIGASRLQIDYLALAQGPHRLYLHNLRLHWHWQQGRLRLQTLSLERADAVLGSSTAPARDTDLPIPTDW